MKTQDLSALLKEKRIESGLSLSQLARLTDTSAATLSRYENGWQRFEIYTLRKIASALKCRLHIELIPIKKHQPIESKEVATKRLKRLFWDKPLTENDLNSYPKWVVARVLELGNLDDLYSIISAMGKQRFLSIVSEIKFKSRKTELFWKHILQKENMPCMEKRSRPIAWDY